MTHPMTLDLTDDEYAALAAEAARNGTSAEALAEEALRLRLAEAAATAPSVPNRGLLERLYREGVIANIPTGEPDTPEEEAERERLAKLFGGGKPLSEIVIEDRGPY
jgi:hypothetical protein